LATKDQEKYLELEKIIEEHKGLPGALMPAMQKTQELFGCVPLKAQQMLADGLNATLSEVYGIATFYSQFNLEPKGEYVISVCLGTACYVKGAQDILDRICEEIETMPGKTSADGRFTVEATRCIGACGLAPVMTINEEVHGRIMPDDVPSILAKYKK
jgi:NADH:ubiquinone oxidoreductase subunit E